MRLRLAVIVLVTIGAFVALPTVTGGEYGGCLNVWTYDHDGEDAVTAIYVDGDDYSQLHYTDEDGDVDDCIGVADDNGVSFATPGGEFLVYVFGGPDFNYQWGVFETTVPEDEQAFESYSRGGIFATEAQKQPGEGEDAYETDGEIEFTFEVFNGQEVSGADVDIEIYVYPEDESQPDDPTATETRTDVSSQSSKTIEFGTPLPDEDGTYRVEAELHTTFAIVDNYRHITDSVDFGTIEIAHGYADPEITAADPDPGSLSLGVEDTQPFSITATDEDVDDDDLEIRWYVDGDVRETGETYTFDAAEHDPGEYGIDVVVSDGIDETDDATASWTVGVIGPPTIEEVWMSGGPIDPGETYAVGEPDTPLFEVSVSDPNVPGDEVNLTWTVNDNEVETGDTFEFDAAAYGYGLHEVSVTASDGLKESEDVVAAWSVDIVAPPEITLLEFPPASVSAGETIELAAEADNPDDRDTSFTYEWTVEETTYAGADVSLTPRTVGDIEVELRVENDFGISATTSETLTVENQPPALSREAPAAAAPTMVTDRPERFVVTIENEDRSAVTVSLLVDGEEVTQTEVEPAGATETVAFERAFAAWGERTVEVVAEDGHGATDRLTWDAIVETPPPTIEDAKPETDAPQVHSGVPVEFWVDATDPDDLELSHVWWVNETRSGEGDRLTHQFNRSGEYPVRVNVTDEAGTVTEHEWVVDVRQYWEPPRLEPEVTSTTFEPDETTAFLTVAVEHPAANERAMRVEIDLELPDDVALESPGMTPESDGDVVTLSAAIEPGETTTLQVALSADEAAAGERLTIGHRVRYYPPEAPEDVTAFDAQRVEVSVAYGDLATRIRAGGDPIPVGGERTTLFIASSLLALVLTYARVVR